MEKIFNITENNVKININLIDGQILWSAFNAMDGINIENGRLGNITIDGNIPKWTHLITSQEEKKDDTYILTFAIEDFDRNLCLTQHITLYKNHFFLRIDGFVENKKNKISTINDCYFLDFVSNNNPPTALFHVEQFSAKYSKEHFKQNEVRLIANRTPHEILMGSYPSQHWKPTSCAWFALLADKDGWYDESPEDGNGLCCGIEFNGKSRIIAGATVDETYIKGNIDDLEHKLLPEKSFEIPPFFIGQFNGNWDEAGYVTQRFAEDSIHPTMPNEHYPWVQYNSWAYGQDINEEQQLKAIERCAELGIELVVLDLGWANMIGDWKPDPIKFPRGLKPLAEKCHSYGMRFGVHLALAQCNTNAPIAKENPEWLIHNKNDYFGAAPLCLGHEPCRNWLIEQLNELIINEGIEYIVQDGEDMVKLCQCKNHTHAPNDSNYSNSQYGLDIVIQALRNKHPNLVIENCEDGGCMMTFKMAKLYHTSITVDNIDSYSTRQGIYGASYVFSPRYSVRYMQDSPTKYTLYSSIFGGPLIFMHRLTEWNEIEVEETKEAIKKYKKLRRIIKSAKIHHIKAPKYNMPGGGFGWDAIQAVTQDKSESIVMVYHALGNSSQEIIKPKGLSSNKKYIATINDWQIIKTGEEFAHNGILITLNQLDAEIIYIKEFKEE